MKQPIEKTANKRLKDKARTLHAKIEAFIRDCYASDVPTPDTAEKFKQSLELWIMQQEAS